MKVRRQRGKAMKEKKRNKRSKGRHQFLSREMKTTISLCAQKNEGALYHSHLCVILTSTIALIPFQIHLFPGGFSGLLG